MIDSEKNKEIIELLRTSFAPKAAFQSSVLFDRNAGQDLDDTAFFLTFDPSNSNAKDAMLHGTYALSYFSFDALRRFLPELMIASLHNRFSYQPIIDAIVLGASSLKN